MKHRKMSKQMGQDIQEIVEFYMQFVTKYQEEARESYEYAWKCMSKGTIEDYLEIIRERKAKENEAVTG